MPRVGNAPTAPSFSEKCSTSELPRLKYDLMGGTGLEPVNLIHVKYALYQLS